MTFKLRKLRALLISAAALILAGTFTAAASGVPGGSGGASSSRLLGDVDNDGTVDITDATCIQRYGADMLALEGADFTAADVNSDNTVDITDTTLIQMAIADIEVLYPIGEPFELPTEPAAQPTSQASTSPTDDEGWGREIIRP